MENSDNNNTVDQPDNYFALLHSSFRQLRQSALVANAPVVTNDDLNEFVRILNNALPKSSEEALVEEAVKSLYYANPRMFQRMLHSGRNMPNGSRRDVRHFVLLTIGLEIVNEFGLENIVHLKWNKETRQYHADCLIDLNNPPDPETFRMEQRNKYRNRRQNESTRNNFQKDEQLHNHARGRRHVNNTDQ